MNLKCICICAHVGYKNVYEMYNFWFVLLSFRLELSESLMTALHTLQKALGEPNAFSQQGAV